MKNKFFYEEIPELSKLKEIFSIYKHKDIDLWPSMAPSIYYYKHYGSFGNFRFKLMRILKFVFFYEKFNADKILKNKIFFSFLIDRKDHHKLWEKAISNFDSSDIVKVDAFHEGKKNLKSILRRFYLKFPNFLEIYRISNCMKKHKLRDFIPNFLDWLYISTQAYYQIKKIDYWAEFLNDLRPKKYVAYSSYRNNDETIITQLMNKMGKTTFTMQNYNIPKFDNFNYESITYENFISDYFLIWGDATKKTLENFIPEKSLLLAGNPQYDSIERVRRTKFDPKAGTAFLSHPSYKKSNFEILNIVKQLASEYPKIQFKFNVHPDNNEEEYAEKLKGVKNLEFLYNKTADKDDMLKKSDFLIMYNSTLVLEAMGCQIPIFRYADENMLDMPVPSLNFKDLEEIKEKFAKLFDKKFYKSCVDKYYSAYNSNFYQPKNKSISENYKSLILNQL